MTKLIAVFAAGALLAGCGGAEEEPQESAPEATEQPADGATEAPTAEETDAPYSAPCGDAVAAAAETAELENTVDDLDPALTACSSLDELQAALDDYPGALDTDVESWAQSRCEQPEDEAITNSDICTEVG